ncbi:MAG: hypothetical protein Q4A65_07850 [Bacillota bacterium]|nr:hypothetical protein [Bacillota bacterium]
MEIKKFIQLSIDIDKKRVKYLQRLCEKYPGKTLKSRSRKRSNSEEYYMRDLSTGEEKFLSIRKQHKVIAALQEKIIAERLIKIIHHNIRIKEELIAGLLPDGVESLKDSLPKCCRDSKELSDKKAKALEAKRKNSKVKQSENPYKREELTVATSFGLWVRTKGELAIAELLHRFGIEFYYEKKLLLNCVRYDSNGQRHVYKKAYYPDFTIVLADGHHIYWEHKGMLDDMQYIERDILKEMDYNFNRIFQSHNLIVTGEGPKNMIDMEGITDIVEGWLMPRVKRAQVSLSR